jgi:tRNA A-37 threonylcarbamoyl transferase component Bud32
MSSPRTCEICTEPLEEGRESSVCKECEPRQRKTTHVLTAEEEIARAKALVFDELRPAGADSKRAGKIGSALETRYELIRPLETTLFSEVFLVQDRELGRNAVIKYLNLSTRFEHVERFKREAQLLANFKHPNIVRVFDSGVDEGKLYMVMEYIEGLALDTFNARLVQQGGEERRIVRMCEIIQEICYALEYLHSQGIVHRDIKPGNIILDRLGKPYLIDFGIARRVSGKEVVTVDGELLGTVAYMSPEQASGSAAEIDRRTDIYSLGVMLYHLLTGQLPFGGSSYDEVIDQIRSITPVMPSHLNHTVSPELERIVLKTLAKEKKERYPSAKELAKDLESIVKPKVKPARARRGGWYARYKLHIAVALCVVAAALIVWGLFPTRERPIDPPYSGIAALEELAKSKSFLRETFSRGELGAFLHHVRGEAVVGRRKLVLRDATLATRSEYSTEDNLRWTLDLAVDSGAAPDVRLRLYADRDRGVLVRWDSSGAGEVLVDGVHKGAFAIPPLGQAARRITLTKSGTTLLISSDAHTVATLSGVFLAPSRGVLEIECPGSGSLRIDSLSLLVW